VSEREACFNNTHAERVHRKYWWNTEDVRRRPSMDNGEPSMECFTKPVDVYCRADKVFGQGGVASGIVVGYSPVAPSVATSGRGWTVATTRKDMWHSASKRYRRRMVRSRSRLGPVMLR
jgi:hypothetical protein